jgi:5-methylcytosine-specific restriction endonuclease McrA
MERICALCGDLIPDSRRKDAKYCSDRCRANSHYARHGDRIRGEWREKNPKVDEVRTCVHCGGEFTRGRSDQVYCSNACDKKAYEKRHAQEIADKNAEKKEQRRRARLERMALPRPIRLCSVEDCDVTSDDDPAFKAGMCNIHYLRDYRADLRAEMRGPLVCAAEGCEVNVSRGRLNQFFCSTGCQQKAWTATTDQDKLRARKAKAEGDRRARKYNNPGYEFFTYGEWLDLLIACGFRCTYCHETPEGLQMDHVFPLARGGPHCLANVTPACGPCNRAKHDSTVEEWLAREESKALKRPE